MDDTESINETKIPDHLPCKFCHENFSSKLNYHKHIGRVYTVAELFLGRVKELSFLTLSTEIAANRTPSDL